jgi:hypothetical protein
VSDELACIRTTGDAVMVGAEVLVAGSVAIASRSRWRPSDGC